MTQMNLGNALATLGERQKSLLDKTRHVHRLHR
jgi:hypothetical protein